MTGAGRSTAAKELEDLGYFVVDNLPPTLVRDVVRLVDDSQGIHQPIAVVVDVRSGSFFDSLQANLASRAPPGAAPPCCSSRPTDDVLVRRQEAARRPHPLQRGGRLLDGLQRERAVMADLRGDADLVIDTTNLNVHQLTTGSPRPFGTAAPPACRSTVISFGFKYGIPVDADFVADMRFLPNPYWVPELRPQNGRDPDVARLRHGPARTPRTSSTATSRSLETVADGLPRRGQALHDRRDRVHRWQAPQRRDDRGDRRAAARRRATTSRTAHRDLGTGVSVAGEPSQASVVALGGGHGLAATLSALRRVVDRRLTAVVTVADNGGSSGRLRDEFGVLPPGDLRMALAALCGDDEWGQHLGRRAAAPLRRPRRDAGPRRRQPADRRRSGSCSATTCRASTGWAGCSARSGRVLPMATTPMDITARVRGADPGRPRPASRVVRGQVRGGHHRGQDRVGVALDPEDPRRARRPSRRSVRAPTGSCWGPARGSPP